jgi:Protein of unknown function (DUF1501)
MITLLGTPRRCCDGLSRRETLKVGSLSLLGGFFNLPSLLALEASGSTHVRPGKAKSVILVYLQGGPATQDMFDLKPDAPSGVRSEFKPIFTSAPGIQICEHLPKMAQWMHRTALVRSTYHQGICHSNMPMYTGYDAVRDQERRPSDPPSMGSVCAYYEQAVLKKNPGAFPDYVYPILKENHLPHLDETFSALMEDLDHSGLLDQTLIVMMGEMGRTPRINSNGGRDHWTYCYSVLLAGAGIRGGSVYGASDAHAAFVKNKPAHVRDICATIYHCLGIDPTMLVYDHGRRPISIAHGGQPLGEILA